MIETRFLLSKLVKFSPKKIRGQEGGTSEWGHEFV